MEVLSVSLQLIKDLEKANEEFPIAQTLCTTSRKHFNFFILSFSLSSFFEFCQILSKIPTFFHYFPASILIDLSNSRGKRGYFGTLDLFFEEDPEVEVYRSREFQFIVIITVKFCISRISLNTFWIFFLKKKKLA